MKFHIKAKKTPKSFYKERTNMFVNQIKKKKNEGIQYIHIQDIESFHTHSKKFLLVLDELYDIKKTMEQIIV